MHTPHSQGGESQSGTTSVLSVDLETLLAGLKNDGQQGPQCWTREELDEQWGKSPRETLKILRRLNHAGRLITCRKAIVDLAGRQTTTPAYRFKENNDTGRVRR